MQDAVFFHQGLSIVLCKFSFRLDYKYLLTLSPKWIDNCANSQDTPEPQYVST